MTLVAIIGTDGSGKTTQSKMIVNKLKNAKIDVVYIQPIFFIFNILLNNKNIKSFVVSPRKIRTSQTKNNKKKKVVMLSQKLFSVLLGYPYAIITYITMKIYFRDKLIICDRYFYQFFFDIYGDWTEDIIKYFPRPDITFFLDGNLDTFYSRMSSSYDSSVEITYYSKVLNLYRTVSSKYLFEKLDTKKSVDEINNTIFDYLINSLRRSDL